MAILQAYPDRVATTWALWTAARGRDHRAGRWPLAGRRCCRKTAWCGPTSSLVVVDVEDRSGGSPRADRPGRAVRRGWQSRHRALGERDSRGLAPRSAGAPLSETQEVLWNDASSGSMSSSACSTRG